MKIVVLGGAGAMGQCIVRDLLESKPVSEIVIADFNQDKAEQVKAALGHTKMSTAAADVTKPDRLALLLKDAAVVINSTPYYYNLNAMEAALLAGCHYLDLGGLFHMTRKQLELHQRFVDKGLLAVLGMGASPGMTNIMAAYGAADLDTVDSIDVAIGYVDFAKSEHPFYPTHSLDTLLDEYSLEPMVYADGKFKAVPALSGELTLEFPPPVGKSKAILILHSEVATLPLSFADKGVKNVTFRLGMQPEFHEKLKFLVELGFAESSELTLKNGSASPREVLNKMIQQSKPPTGDPDDCEVVRVDVSGTKDGQSQLIRVEMTVKADTRWKMSCDALDTIVPPSVVAQLIAGGQIKASGVLAPEACIPPEPFFAELKKRNLNVTKSKQTPAVPSKTPTHA